MSGGLEVAEKVVRRKKRGEAEQEETHNEVLLLVVGIQLEEEGHTQEKSVCGGLLTFHSSLSVCLCAESEEEKRDADVDVNQPQ